MYTQRHTHTHVQAHTLAYMHLICSNKQDARNLFYESDIQGKDFHILFTHSYRLMIDLQEKSQALSTLQIIQMIFCFSVHKNGQ